MQDIQKKLNKARDTDILNDEEIRKFYLPYFSNDPNKVQAFIKKCLKRDKTRKMLLLTQWLTEIADKIPSASKSGAGNLQIVFLITLAESVAKYSDNYTKEGDSKKFIDTFFTFLSSGDKEILVSKFKTINSQKSKLKCIIGDFYDIRNRAVHNGIFFDFFFRGDCTTMASIRRGKKNKKRAVVMENDLDYNTFKEIIVRSSIKIIEKANGA